MSAPGDTPREDYFADYAFIQRLVDSGLLAAMKGSDVKVLVSLMRHMDKKTRQSFPSLDRIGREAGLGRTVVQAAIGRLTGYGAISKHRFSSGRKFKNVYTIIENQNLYVPIKPIKPASGSAENRDIVTGKWYKLVESRLMP